MFFAMCDSSVASADPRHQLAMTAAAARAALHTLAHTVLPPSPSALRSAFEQACVPNTSDVIENPGAAGLQPILAEHVEKNVTVEVINQIFEKQGWAKEESFDWSKFQCLVASLKTSTTQLDAATQDDDGSAAKTSVNDQDGECAQLVRDDPAFEEQGSSKVAATFPNIAPEELESLDNTHAAQQLLLLCDTSKHARINAYIAERCQSYIATNPTYGEEQWAKEYYYTEIQTFLMQASLESKTLAHKMHGKEFISLIPPMILLDPKRRYEASALVAATSENMLSAFNESIWKRWESTWEPVLTYTDKAASTLFVEFLHEEYFHLLASTHRTQNTNSAVPLSATDHAAAEELVETWWHQWRMSLADGARNAATVTAPTNYRTKHYPEAVRRVLQAAASKNAMESQETTRKRSAPTDGADSNAFTAGMLALLAGNAHSERPQCTEEIPKVSARQILEETKIGKHVYFEGLLLRHDPAPRSLARKESSGSPKKNRGNQLIVDMVIADRTGPIMFSFTGDRDVETFVQKAATHKAEQIFVTLSRARVGTVPSNNWNGTIITQMRMLYSVPQISGAEGTLVTLSPTCSCPFVTEAIYVLPSAAVCITDFAHCAGQLRAPFRGTFRGVVQEAEGLELSQSGSAKRMFKVMDALGYYLRFCALDSNAENPALQDNEDVVMYFGTGRTKIGTSPGMVYLMRESVIVSVGRCAQPWALREEVIIEGE